MVDVGLTAWGLRDQAQRRGVHVSQPQLDEYVRWGLLPESTQGRWPTEAVGRLVAIHEAAPKARQLYRRAVLLGRDPHFPVPPSKLWDAMVEMVKSSSGITAAKRKMG